MGEIIKRFKLCLRLGSLETDSMATYVKIYWGVISGDTESQVWTEGEADPCATDIEALGNPTRSSGTEMAL